MGPFGTPIATSWNATRNGSQPRHRADENSALQFRYLCLDRSDEAHVLIYGPFGKRESGFIDTVGRSLAVSRTWPGIRRQEAITIWPLLDACGHQIGVRQPVRGALAVAWARPRGGKCWKWDSHPSVRTAPLGTTSITPRPVPQIRDRPGRSRAVLPLPVPGSATTQSAPPREGWRRRHGGLPGPPRPGPQ
jgi:hypothetical protein